MSVQDSLTTGFELAYMALKLNCDGLTEDKSREHPIAGSSCVNWVLGHVLYIRSVFSGALGVKPETGPELEAFYGRGTSGKVENGTGIALADLLAHYERNNPAILARIAELTPEELATIVNHPAFGPKSLEQYLALLLMHESYHIGQLGLLRRGLGLPPGIT
jgi:uncharacterized damage-inducible protein DinB